MRMLAVLAEAETTKACLDAAIAAARMIGGDVHIDALNVVVDPNALATSYEEVDLQMLRERHEGSAFERAAAVRLQFVSCVAGLGDDDPPIEWRAVPGAEEAEVVTAADGADLVIVAVPHNMDGHDALHAALFKTGRPCLVVPNSGTGTREAAAPVMLYWDGSDRPTPALEAALPWLRASSGVTLLLVDQPAERAAWVTQWLGDRDVGVTVKIIARDHDPLGQIIVEAACALGAALLVFGPRTHGLFVDWLRGGATHEIVTKTQVPTLLSH
jgi:nucleotide-binding universal stress UspA family protein